MHKMGDIVKDSLRPFHSRFVAKLLRRDRILSALLALVTIWITPVALAQSDIQTLQALNRAGRSAEALVLADQMLMMYEGEPAFDLEYGIAAVDSGLISEGIFALERVIMNQPQNLYARLELARAYFAAGEDDRARAEFNRVLAEEPPQEVRDNVRPYLDAISAREGQRRPVWRGSFDLTSGFDSNINASTEDDLSALLGLPPGSVNAATPQEDSFTVAAGAISYSIPLTKQTDLSASANLSHRENSSGDLPQTIAALGANYSFRDEVRTWRFGLMANQFRLDNQDYRNMLGATGSLRVSMGPATSLTLGLQGSQLSYPDNPGKDAFLSMGTLTIQQALGGRYRAVLDAGVSVGLEDADDDSAPGALQNTERDILGANLGLGLSFTPNLQMNLSLRAQHSEYSEALTLPPVLREDTNISFSTRVNWRVADNWFLGFNLTATDNDSTAVFTDYQREQISVNARYLFR